LRAYLRYRMALCLGRLGRHRLEAALLRACVEARTGDNFGRARAEQNALIRRLAREYSIPLVDFERIAADASPRGVTGDELFIDGHHPNIKGYALLADALAEAVARSSGGRVRAPIAAAGRLLDDLGCSREGQSRALVESGRWLLSVGARQAYPFQRWSMAADRFRRAAELEPDDFSARFGSALAAAALGGRFVEPNLDWLGERGLFYGGDYDVSTEDFPEAVEKLRAAGVPGPQLLELRRTFRPDPSATGWLARRGRALEFGVVSAARKLRLAMKSSRPEAVERSRPERSDSNRRAGERPSGALAAPRRVRPFDPAYRAELAAWAARTDRPRLAVLLLAAARAADPDPQTRLRIAMIYQSLKDYDRESAVLRELVRDRPTDAEARTDAGLCLDLKGDPEGAASELNAALRLDPKRLSTYLTLAAVDSALGRRGEARRVLDAGLAAEAGSDPRMRALLKDGLRTIPSPR
ncbi:MAG TPA: tetratricopeptide repeat protein, partial [Elusimicrobiota bacterium]|nr:tetratricopeptide repeat protein [Elusimicrobiota bacterium]